MRAPSQKLAFFAVLAFAGVSMGATVWAFPVPPVRDNVRPMKADVDQGYGVNTYERADPDCRILQVHIVDAKGAVHASDVDECD